MQLSESSVHDALEGRAEDAEEMTEEGADEIGAEEETAEEIAAEEEKTGKDEIGTNEGGSEDEGVTEAETTDETKEGGAEDDGDAEETTTGAELEGDEQLAEGLPLLATQAQRSSKACWASSTDSVQSIETQLAVSSNMLFL